MQPFRSFVIVYLVFLVAGFGCSNAFDTSGQASSPATSSASDPSGGKSTSTEDSFALPAGGDASSSDAGGTASPPATTGQGEAYQAGTLTAGDWSDNLNMGWFASYLKEMADANPQWATLPLTQRVLVQVLTPGGVPVGGVRIRLLVANQVVSQTFSGTDGLGAVLPSGEPGGRSIEAQLGAAAPVVVALPEAQTSLTVTLPVAAPAVAGMDLAFVVDVTGSMGDELGFLKAEVEAIVSQVQAKSGNANLRFGLVVYRDDGDEFVVKSFDFTTDLKAFKANLAAQSADGGGDTPEAVPQAFAAAAKLSWRPDNVARVVVHIADAEPHETEFAKYFMAVQALQAQGVRVYPVASSGHDDGCEYVMRAAAVLTAGRYVFLTDDSGVGVAQGHAKPHIPCFDVELLLTKLVRLLAAELQGSYIPADPKAIISSSGDPKEGACQLDAGVMTYIY